MKRTVSIFMLAVMMLTSVHATWSWHFCGNNLRSVRIASEHGACCCGESDDSLSDNNGIQNIRQPYNPCCSDYMLKISTDDFSVKKPDITYRVNSQPLYPVLFFCNIEDKPDNCSVIQNIFPPGGLAKYNVNILASICILRI